MTMMNNNNNVAMTMRQLTCVMGFNLHDNSIHNEVVLTHIWQYGSPRSHEPYFIPTQMLTAYRHYADHAGIEHVLYVELVVDRLVLGEKKTEVQFVGAR
jgi:hypothetical protein